MAKPKTRNRNTTSQPPGKTSGPARESAAKTGRNYQGDRIFGLPKSRIPHLIIFLVISIGGCYAWIWFTNNMGIQQYTFEIVAEYPHDRKAFTQGLIYNDGMMFESNGKYGESDIREFELKTGEIKRVTKLDDKYFGEGLTLFDGKFYQLTWEQNKCFVYDESLTKVGEFDYDGEGWGLTHDGQNLIMSNGSSTLKFIDPTTFEVIRKISVRYGRARRQGLNELEYVSGKIYANDLNRPFIYEINPRNGDIEAEIDLRGLVPKDEKVDVLNGIAFNTTTGNLLVTGKYWSKIYEIKRVPKQKAKSKK